MNQGGKTKLDYSLIWGSQYNQNIVSQPSLSIGNQPSRSIGSLINSQDLNTWVKLEGLFLGVWVIAWTTARKAATTLDPEVNTDLD